MIRVFEENGQSNTCRWGEEAIVEIQKNTNEKIASQS
jgi:hypothetical protein